VAMFAVAAGAYDRFMGRYSSPLAPVFADFASVVSGLRCLDVGCGPGSLTAELANRVGADSVSAVDPSEPFVAAVAQRFPGVEVLQATAEDLPFDDDVFDSTLAQLVVHFMADPVAGLREMRRVTKPGGVVAACVWDMGGRQGPLSKFWAGVDELYPGRAGESERPGTREGHLSALLGEAGLEDITDTLISVTVQHESFDEWWEPFTMGVGPAGAFVASLDKQEEKALRDYFRSLFRDAPFLVGAGAWAARGVVPE